MRDERRLFNLNSIASEFAGMGDQLGGTRRDRSNIAVGQILPLHVFWTCHAGARHYRVQCRVARCDIGRGSDALLRGMSKKRAAAIFDQRQYLTCPSVSLRVGPPYQRIQKRWNLD